MTPDIEKVSREVEKILIKPVEVSSDKLKDRDFVRKKLATAIANWLLECVPEECVPDKIEGLTNWSKGWNAFRAELLRKLRGEK